NTNLGASNEMGEWEAWIKAGTGDDKTDIVVVADFWERTGGVFSRDRDISSNGDFTRFGGFDSRSVNEPGRVGSFRLIPKLFFSLIRSRFRALTWALAPKALACRSQIRSIRLRSWTRLFQISFLTEAVFK